MVDAIAEKGIRYLLNQYRANFCRTHFGAVSDGDRFKIIYKITKPPENGTLYWVAGEQEVRVFTQHDIDEERILYAQRNMQAFQDRFEFSVENEFNDKVHSTTYVRIIPVFHPRTLVTDANYITPISDAHLNASIIKNSNPRFYVTEPPHFGSLVISPNINKSVDFFTYDDIMNKLLFYISNKTESLVLDFAELQLDADNVQPSRFRFNIEVHPSSAINYIAPIDKEMNASILPDFSRSSLLPSIKSLLLYLPITLFFSILVVFAIVIIFRRHSKNQKQKRLEAARKKREFDARMNTNLEKKSNLLSSTVYATVGRSRHESFDKRPQRALQTFDGSKRPESLISSSPRGKAQSRGFSSASLDYQAASSHNTPEPTRSRADRYHSTKLKENQYWV
ncbi:unnamed protein product [Thelazia callipaeda]|uniref:Uncharacterized protein n=1 Tax=Thelazia callipaeda TaxID=103827 RepID=A0A3P7LL03_THECL|nr:unnamed protein product [Thelazia callipaeda]